MGLPQLEEILALLMRLRRVAVLLILAFVLLIVWLAVRRAERKGLEVALLLFAAGIASFTAAVFGPRPPLTEAAALGLALLAAVMLVASVGAVLWYGLRGRRRPRAVEHSHAPWENGGW